jgi:regulator of sirC expression with transglutaminase-like and TPR domain
MTDEIQALHDLLSGKSAEMELDRAALALARIEYPELDAAETVAQLDRHALAIAERAEDLSDGRCFVETTNAYLFTVAGFHANRDDYYDPANSCLNRVLETGAGIPITLSVVYIEIARRLAKPVSGVGLPGHFVIRYDDPGYHAIIDPFDGGAILDAAGCCKVAGMESLEAGMLDPVGKRQVVMRMINNLRGIYFSRREGAKALAVLDLLLAANPDAADEHKQRGAALLQMRRINEALGAFRRYPDLAPHAADRERIEEQMRNIAFWIASRN